MLCHHPSMTYDTVCLRSPSTSIPSLTFSSRFQKHLSGMLGAGGNGMVVSGNGDLKIGCLLFHLLSHPNHHLSSQHFSCRSPPRTPQPPHTPPHHPRLLPICPSSIFYRCWLPHLPGLSLSRKLLNPAWNDWLLFVVGGVDDWPGDVLVDLLMLPEVFGVAT
uniref:Uncharacterized protein n=1 Tax=Pycnococcus provasolii TaxID=41880 RepID=A0A7S2YX45_9CHLO|mmetsp:Transcript_2779/g.7061  ORF Transcript_2779/g.7061 Transcript_2779/m.7061 type:complete len:162 (+) Transcript_2779:785-1270(+)